jgi:RNA polymerase sigma-70 factor (ECF subfamily)
LIIQLKDPGNCLAWNQFVAHYQPFLQHVIQRQGVPDRHVADVTQQVLLAIAKSVESWQDDGQPASFRRWLRRVARNVVIKYMTRERRAIGGQGGTEAIDLLHDLPAAPDREQEARYEHELILWAAQQVRREFQAKSWEVFWATMIDNRSVAEVAEQYEVSPGSIYMSRSRILARIRRMIEEL